MGGWEREWILGKSDYGQNIVHAFLKELITQEHGKECGKVQTNAGDEGQIKKKGL